MARRQILVCNCGSSSIKVDIFAAEDVLTRLAGATVERIHEATAQAFFESVDSKKTEILEKPGYAKALFWIDARLAESGIFTAETRLAAGHRVVHGQDFFKEPKFIDERIIMRIEDCKHLAPLHNPPNIEGIRVCMELYHIPQVAVFDTAFHANMPDYARLYAIPGDLSRKYHIQRYGFHGTSHHFIARRAAGILGKRLEETNLITLHLGNGCSACAIQNGVSVDTSMGFTPLEGLIMGTRSGDIDPAIFSFLSEHAELSPKETEEILNFDSGLKGLSGFSDMREVISRANSGESSAALALDMFCYRIRKYVGAYLAVLGKVDAIVFAGGIGENAEIVWRKTLERLTNLGIHIGEKKNADASGFEISDRGSATRVFILYTDEQAYIAKETWTLIQGVKLRREKADGTDGAGPAGTTRHPVARNH